MTSYAKRLEQRKQHGAIKEHERELKEEREAERQVRMDLYKAQSLGYANVHHPGSHPKNQRAQIRKGGEGTVRKNGRENAPQTSRACQAEREAQQVASFVNCWLSRILFVCVFFLFLDTCLPRDILFAIDCIRLYSLDGLLLYSGGYSTAFGNGVTIAIPDQNMCYKSTNWNTYFCTDA